MENQEAYDKAKKTVEAKMGFYIHLAVYVGVNPPVALPDSPGTLPKPCNAGFVGVEWLMEDFTQSEVQQILWHHVLHFQKVPLQGFSSVPAESVTADYCNIRVNVLLIIINFATSPQYLWFKWPLLGWGIGLFFHGMSIFVFSGRKFKGIKENMIQEEMKRQSH